MITVITTISSPSNCTRALADRLHKNNDTLIVVGDKKGPGEYSLPGSTFLSLQDQLAQPFTLVGLLPTGHYTRKNVGYLVAMAERVECIYETDDDNAPLGNWAVRSRSVEALLVNGDR